MSEKVRNGQETAGAISRRGFVRMAAGAAALGIGAAALGAPPRGGGRGTGGQGQDEEFKLEDGDDAGTGLIYRAIPACKIRISTVVAGPAGDEVQRRLVARGVNYFHKVDGCGSREFRQKLDWDYFYCDCVIDRTDKIGAIQEFEARRSQAGVDVIHFFKIHATLSNPEDVQHDQPVFEAFRSLRDQGKTKWLAISLHASPEMFEACVESGLFQQIQIPFNPLNAGPVVRRALQKAQEAGIGVVAMKTMLGGPAKWQDDPKARQVLDEYWPEGTSAAQAMLKWILAQPGITAAVPHCENVQQADENCVAAGAKLQAWEQQGVERLAAALSPTWCRSCRTCEKACPRNVRIPDILRYRMYATAYRRPADARRLYAALSPSAALINCDNCGRCQESCPHGLAVTEMLADARQLLA